MKRDLNPIRKIEGTIVVPGDKSIAHRAALLSIIAHNKICINNFPQSSDCMTSLAAAEKLGVEISDKSNTNLTITPPAKIVTTEETIVDCGNSGTTARLLSGLIAGTNNSLTIAGDDSLSSRPMKRIVSPLSEMGAELFDTDGHLPIKIRGRKLLPFDYRLPVASAQVKSALLLAGLVSGCSVTIKEDILCRDHTEIMISHLGGNIQVRDIKPVIQQDPHDPRKKKRVVCEDFLRETVLQSGTSINGGEIDIPGDISTAAYFLAAAALSRGSVTVENVGLNPTRTAFLSYLKSVGATMEITNRVKISGEFRGDVKVTGSMLKARKVQGETTVGLIDEIPIVAVIAAFTEGTTIIRDAAELKVKESDRLAAVAYNLKQMGVSCGLLEDGLIIEGCKELNGADLKSFGDHRIAMAFSIATMFAVGPSTIDDDSVVDISCPGFYDLMSRIVVR